MLVVVLSEWFVWQQNQFEELEQEMLKLKGETTKPKIKPSTMDKKGSPEKDKFSSVGTIA